MVSYIGRHTRHLRVIQFITAALFVVVLTVAVLPFYSSVNVNAA